jgi:two-component system, chemotaxis family, CheB/CheR fusion protein
MLMGEQEPRRSDGQQPWPEERLVDDNQVGPIKQFPMVGLGASAGGLEALHEFFRQMPTDSGLAFVIVVHLSPNRKGSLPELLQKYTEIAVHEIVNEMVVQPDNVYVIPSNREVTISQGKLYLNDLPAPHGWPVTIDTFMHSLAEDQQEKAICIIFSGAGSDGALGLRSVKENGGLVIVQEPESARYAGMPGSAIATGLADYILPPEQMPQKLLEYVSLPAYRRLMVGGKPPSIPYEALSKIFTILRAQTGHDFSYYKYSTIGRRIARRLLVTKQDNIHAYINFLRENPAEAMQLFNELLIGVTHFFRDSEAFVALQEKGLPHLFKDRDPNLPLRVWVPACSTGEEAYSLAILLREEKEKRNSDVEIQIFATDLDERAIDVARAGVYPATIVKNVSPERLERFFYEHDHSFEIRRQVREMVVFAEQNVARDPPFSNLDLISCRNLLIYLSVELQKRILGLFYYALKRDGVLFLGPSETLGEYADFYSVLDRKWRLFRRRPETPAHAPMVEFFSALRLEPEAPLSERKLERKLSNEQLIQRLLLEHHDDACILINKNYHLLYAYGPVDNYLRVTPGEGRLNVLEMAREGLDLELLTAVRSAASTNEIVSRQGIGVKRNGGETVIDLTVKPLPDTPSRAGLMLIIFEKAPQSRTTETAAGLLQVSEDDEPKVQAMQEELKATKRHLQSALEDMQVAYEELKSSNEEMQVANEELQSTNEELKTSKEELQSMNEELVTINVDLQSKNDQLTATNNDLHNLLRATRIATIFLDNDLHVKGFTPAAAEIFNLIKADVGRPIKHITSNLKYQRLAQDAEEVLEHLATREVQVETEEGEWFRLRIMPYRTVENAIDGVVITFAVITQQKQSEAEQEQLRRELERAREFSRQVLDSVSEPMLVLDDSWSVVQVNRAFSQVFRLSAGDVVGKAILDRPDGRPDVAHLLQILSRVAGDGESLDGEEAVTDFPSLGPCRVRLTARRIDGELDGKGLIVVGVRQLNRVE